ncbi:MAG: response regulator [Treponema sp.]|nr:response regulator [Treponema sp.]
MPYGKVLVVDDVDTNLYVAEGLLKPYMLDIDTANSGIIAIDFIKSGKTYDLIFMDHMMPKMDGIETTMILRELGYEGSIVALTANALTGNEKMFEQNGFDGFIPKPIDMVFLNTILNKFVRDKHPQEAVKYKPRI